MVLSETMFTVISSILISSFRSLAPTRKDRKDKGEDMTLQIEQAVEFVCPVRREHLPKIPYATPICMQQARRKTRYGGLS